MELGQKKNRLSSGKINFIYVAGWWCGEQNIYNNTSGLFAESCRLDGAQKINRAAYN